MSVDASTRDRMLRLLGVELRKASYAGQRYKHGWIPVAAGAVDLVSPADAARDYGDELDRVEFSTACVVARSEGTLTIQTDMPDGHAQIHASPSHSEANDWAATIDAMVAQSRQAGGQPGPNGLVDEDVEGSMLVGYDPSGNVAVRWLGDEDDGFTDNLDDFDGFTLSRGEAEAMASALRDMAYVTEDYQNVPDDEPDDASSDAVDDEPDDGRTAVLLARDRTLRLAGIEMRKFNPAQKRQAKGTATGGQWRSISDRALADVFSWLNTTAGGQGGDPLAAYSQPQLKTVATQLGLNPPKGMKLVPLKVLVRNHAARLHGSGHALPAGTAVTLGRHATTHTQPMQGMAHQASISVSHGGVHVGAVHQDNSGNWTAALPSGAGYTVTIPAGATQKQGVDELIRAHLTHLAAAAPIPAAPAPVKAAPRSTATPAGLPAGAKKLSAAITGGVPGVYQVDIPPPPVSPGSPSWVTPAKQSIDIYQGGTKIGTMHQHPGYWQVEDANGRLVTGSGSTRTKTGAVTALLHHHQHVAPVTTPVVGATLTRASTFSSLPGATSLEVDFNGIDVGGVHDSGPGTGWTAFPPTGATYGLQANRRGQTYADRDDAIKALVDAYKQHTPPTRPHFSTSASVLQLGPSMPNPLDVSYAGVDLGTVAFHPKLGGWLPVAGSAWSSPRHTQGPAPRNGWSTLQDAMDALLAAHVQVNGPISPPGTVASGAAGGGMQAPAVKAVQDVLYGVDPKAKTVARQLQVYTDLRRTQFDSLSPAEQSTVLGDLSYIATTSKSSATAARAQKLFNRFTPPGTPLGAVPQQAVHLPASVSSAQTRVTDPAGTPSLLKLKPAAKRGNSGDGWTRTAAGGTGPWGQYGAAGLMLRHVDAQGVERFLMVERGPGISDPGKWQFPGGAKEEKESFYEGAAREVLEELGFQPTDLDAAKVHGTHTAEVPGVMVPGTQGGQVPWAYVSIAASVPTQIQPDLSTHHARMETSDARWMTAAEIAQLDTSGKLLKPLAGGQLQQNVMTLFPGGGPAAAAAPGGPIVRPARLTGAPSVPASPHKPSRGLDLIPDKAGRDQLRQDVKKARKQYAGKVADDRLAAIGAMQGFDETPTVASKAEMDRLLATGDYIEIWRGVKGAGGGGGWGATRGGKVSSTKTAAQVNEDLRSGVAYYGHGIFGNGYYFATDKKVAKGYADGTSGSLVRALIPKAAKTKRHPDVVRVAHSVSSSTSKGGTGEDGTLYDEGRYAAALGLDAIEIDHNTSGAWHVASQGKPAFNVVNRSILIVQEA